MAKKKSNSRFDRKKSEMRDEFDRSLEKMPWRKRTKKRTKRVQTFSGPCDAEIQLADELLDVAVQEAIEAEDAEDAAFAAAVARDICLNG